MPVFNAQSGGQQDDDQHKNDDTADVDHDLGQGDKFKLQHDIDCSGHEKGCYQ